MLDIRDKFNSYSIVMRIVVIKNGTNDRNAILKIDRKDWR